METKKVLIVDDESIARERVRRFLNEIGIALQIDEAANGIEALELIPEFKPDILFLDIQMPGLTGFEVLQQLESRNFQIIFQTAYDEYAVKAFEESACDYLLKPFSKERLEKALHKALVAQKQTDALKKLELNLRQKEFYLDKIAYKQSGKIKILAVADISCFISRDHYTCVYGHTGKEQMIDFSISYLQEHLNPRQFVRCHRNSIASMKHLKSVGGTSDSQVELTNGMTLPLSRANRAAVLEQFKDQS